jgi:hypothetical protein
VYIAGYHVSMKPPTIPLHPNVMVLLTHSGPECLALNRRLADPVPQHRRLAEYIDGWRATGAPLAFYDYNPVSVMAHAPYAAGRKFNDDVKWLAQRGFIGYHSQSDGTLWGFYGLNHVSLARTLWDTSTDFDALQRDYFRCLFGAAAEPVQALQTLFETALEEYPEPVAGTLGVYLTPDTLRRAAVLLDEAAAAERADAVRARLAVLAAQVQYGARLMDARRTAEEYTRTQEPETRRRLRRERDALLRYVETHPVAGAYSLGGVMKGLDLYLVGERGLLNTDD